MCHHKVWQEPGPRGVGARPGPTHTPARRPGQPQGTEWHPIHSAPASRPGSCLSQAHSPRACQSTPQSSLHPLTLTLHPPSAPRPPRLPAPPRPSPPAHTAPSRVHQLSSEAPATGGQVSPRRYLHPRRGQRPRPVCLESPLWSLPGERAGGRGPLATLALTRGWVG